MRPQTYKQYLLILLMVILAFNFADRIALGLVLQDIKGDLHLTDTQLGLLGGIAFALLYSIMGIPIARWADRGNRVTIIAVSAAIWSLILVLTGWVSSFAQLLLIRIGVGIGEAGSMPPANSLIADYFTRAERPRATALYIQGLNISPVVAYFVAGWLNLLVGWRMMFVWMSLPGLVLAAVTWLTIKEPRVGIATIEVPRKGADLTNTEVGVASSSPEPNLKRVFLTLWANPTFRNLLYAFSIFYFFACGISQWQPAFFVRSFGMSTGALGTWLAVVNGVGGVIGTYWGGHWASRYAANNERLQLRVMAIINAGFNSLIWALIYFAHDYRAAFGWMALSTLGGMTILGPMYAITQTLVPTRMRAMAIAIILLSSNLIGTGLGPLAVGIVSDALEPIFGSESLRYSLLALSPGYIWVSWHLWRASQTVGRDLAAVEETEWGRMSAHGLAVTPAGESF